MKIPINPASLKINRHDPRFNKAFQCLSETLNHRVLPKACDWELLRTLCYQQFQDKGYDLQSGAWFCLINGHLSGWNGLLQALELFTDTWEKQGEFCWPPPTAVTLRQEILEWFSHHVVTQLYIMPVTSSDIILLHRAECLLRRLVGFARDTQFRSESSLENVRYFLQVRTRSIVATPVRPTVASFSPDTTESVSEEVVMTDTLSLKISEQALPSGERMRTYFYGMLTGSIAGILITSLTLYWTYRNYPAYQSNSIQLPVALLQRSEESLRTGPPYPDKKLSNKIQAEIVPVMHEQLLWLSSRTPQHWMMQGEMVSQRLEALSPGNSASAVWRKTMQEKAGSVTISEHWRQGMAALTQIEERLEKSENSRNRYLTVSELKTAVYRIKQHFMQQGEPLNEQLSALQQYGEIEQVSFYQIQEQLNALLARYTLLRMKTSNKDEE